MQDSLKEIDRLILNELTGIPVGLPVNVLWRRIAESNNRVSTKVLSQWLLELQADGFVESRGMHWRLKPDAKARANKPSDLWKDGNKRDEAGISALFSYLEAYPAEVEPSIEQLTSSLPIRGDLVPSPNLLSRLLPHYTECLRIAGASRLIQEPGRYRTQFLFLKPTKAWWPHEGGNRRLRIRAEHIPAQLVEGLHARQGQPVMLGYPLSVYAKGDEVFIRPVGVLACRWGRDGDDLVIDPLGVAPELNPDWVGAIKRNRVLARVMAWSGQNNPDPEDNVARVGGGQWSDVDEMAGIIGSFLAAETRTPLRPARPDGGLPLGQEDGIFNVLGLFLTSASSYNAGACRDLTTMAGLPPETFSETALGPLFGMEGTLRGPIPVLPPVPLGEDQFVAVRDGLSDPLTVVTGPPGTGKSQVVVALMVSAALAGRSVLFASRTHQALDAVEDRMREMLPDRMILARAKALDHAREFSFVKALDAILARGGDAASMSRLENKKLEPLSIESSIWEIIEAVDMLSYTSDELGRLSVEIAKAEAEAAYEQREISKGKQSLFLWRRLKEFLTNQGSRGWAADTTLDSLRRKFDEAAARHHEQVAAVEKLQAARPLGRALKRLSSESAGLLTTLADCLEALGTDERERLAALRGDLGLNAGWGDPRVRQALWERGYDIVLRHFPLWATTTLAAANRIPLIPALFDYVVIDEATTCDIASALPLLARAKHAVIVGDKMQTAMIADLDSGRELEMLDKVGLNIPGIGRFAFTQANIFDLASSASTASRHILRDHFRCHIDIAGYVSEAFYGRRLTVLTDDDKLKPPPGTKPGLHWTDVKGPLLKHGKGCVSMDEAEAVSEHLRVLLEEQNYMGTIGVVTPFARQAELIIRTCEDRISPARRENAKLRVATSHAFQGDARDVVLISLCYGNDMPHGAEWFLRESRELINVAVSRARSVCHVFGDRDAALRASIPHLSLLARRIASPDVGRGGDDRFESPWEKRLYDALRARGLNPIPQYPLAGRRLDLALIKGDRKLDIEVDGDAYHRDPDGFRKVSDLSRDSMIRGLGWVPVRFWVYDLKSNMEACVERVIAELG